ncbi:MAG: RluA family pseudouridine synthase [Lachnospiraceae bacterium]|nr:RluA family pseudouridine synthase [Lachnospiraceae bacterium]
MKLSFTVSPEYDQIRIDKCISSVYEDLSRSYVQRLIDDGAVLCNGRSCKSNLRVSGGDTIEIEAPDHVLPEIEPENIPLDILYEDEDVIVVNKPKGMVVHPANGHYSGTLVNALMYHCKDLSGINGVLRPGIVHRIDMDTTGSVIACKNDIAHNEIARQLSEHSIKRHYYALVHGVIEEESGTVDQPIGRSEKDRKKMSVNLKNGKNAVTHYTVLKRYQDYTLLDCHLETGRTHQIRVHMAFIGHPIVGDCVYGKKKTPCELQGQTLHAYLLGFHHPRTGEYIETTAPMPEYFTSLLSSLKPF